MKKYWSIRFFTMINLLLMSFILLAQSNEAIGEQASEPANTSTHILFLLDASGSMEARVNGQTQMEIAKNSIQETLKDIPPTTPIALRAYGHRINKTDKSGSCTDTELLVPFETQAGNKINRALSSIQPKGYTPIAYALQSAAEDFRAKEVEAVIILLSDGEETCDGDPIQEAKDLLAQGFNLTIHTIGFRVDEKTRQQLQAISTTTNGVYYDATDATTLTQSLKQVTEKALLIDKETEAARGQEIRGGSQYDSAIPLQAGVEYRLDHHQRKNEYDYFSINLKRGEIATFTISTQENGLRIGKDNQTSENDRPYAGLRILDATYKQKSNCEVIGKRHGKKLCNYVSLEDQQIYLLVGSRYNHMHKDSPFRVDVKAYFDANTNQDAGEDILHAHAINDFSASYTENSLFISKDKDFYQFTAMGGQSYTITITPTTMNYLPRLEIYNADRKSIFKERASNVGSIIRSEPISISQSEPMTFAVSGYSFDDQTPGKYEFSIQTDVAAQDMSIDTEAKEINTPAENSEADDQSKIIQPPNSVEAIASRIHKEKNKDVVVITLPENWILYSALIIAFLIIIFLSYKALRRN